MVDEKDVVIRNSALEPTFRANKEQSFSFYLIFLGLSFPLGLFGMISIIFKDVC